MPTATVCMRCGRTLDAGETAKPGNHVERLCEGCAGWERARATDQDDRYYNTGIDAVTPGPRPKDDGRRV